MSLVNRNTANRVPWLAYQRCGAEPYGKGNYAPTIIYDFQRQTKDIVVGLEGK